MKLPVVQPLKPFRAAAMLGPILFVASLLLLVAVPREAKAQTPTANPPTLMTYQGYLVDANGGALATNAPQNYDVIFRIYNASQGGSDLWAEQQTVTVDKGYFSVLLGQGSQYNSEPHGNLASLFAAADASDRYVELTVKGIGSGGSDVTILPRLRLLTSPYSFLAQNAVNASSLVNNSNAAVMTASGSAVTVNGNITANHFVGNGANLTALNGSAVTSGTIADARLSGNVALRSGGNTFTGNQQINNGSFEVANSSGSFYYSGYAPGSGAVLLAGLTGANNHGPQFRFAGAAGGGWYDIGQNDANSFVIERNDVANFTVSSSGNVGIGITAPAAPLHVSSAGWPTAIIDGTSIYGTWLDLHNSTAPSGSSHYHFITTGSGNGEGGGKLLIGYGSSASSESTVMTLTPSGYVGIGTTAPSVAKLEIRNTSAVTSIGGAYSYLSSGGTGRITTGSGNFYCSILADGRILAPEMDAFSDVRIKDIIGRSNSRQDLKTLMGIQITDYTMVDKVASGDRQYKKVIAQQVEKVYPQAVSCSTNVVPDIYAKAEAKAGWIPLTKHLDPVLKVGDQVRLITDKDASLHEVTEVNDDGFRIKDPLDGPVFVYGRQVNDFRTVDYDALSMLNVSATQALYRELQAKEQEIRHLQQAVDKIAAREQEQEARFEKLEAMMTRPNASEQTASLR